jgi:hypothetical protein
MLVDVPLCTSQNTVPDHAPTPITPHQHELCLLCHGAGMPLALVAVASLLPAPLVQFWQPQSPYHASPRFASRFWRYQSRAPPTLA